MLSIIVRQRIKELRREIGLSPEQAAVLADISSRYWRHIERGDRGNPSTNTLDKMARALGYRDSGIFYAPIVSPKDKAS